MIYCRKCGAAIQEGANACPVCGTFVDGYIRQPGQNGYNPARASQESDGAVASMICGIVSFFLFGLPLSIVALVLASKDKKKNGGIYSSYAKVGFITGLISLILQCVLILLVIIAFVLMRTFFPAGTLGGLFESYGGLL